MSVNTHARKLLAVLLMLALVMPTVAITQPVAAAAVTPPTEDTVLTGSVAQNFEFDGGEGVPVIANSYVVGLSTQQAHSGSTALELDPEKNSQAGRPRFVVAANGENIKLMHGAHYKISFWVYADTLDSETNTLSYYAAAMADTTKITGTDKTKHAIQYSGKQKITRRAWTQLVMDIPAVSHIESTTDGSGPLTQAQEYYLTLGVCYDVKLTKSIYIDDIVVTMVDGVQDYDHIAPKTYASSESETTGIYGTGYSRTVSDAHDHTTLTAAGEEDGTGNALEITMIGSETDLQTCPKFAVIDTDFQLMTVRKGHTYLVTSWLYNPQSEAMTVLYRLRTEETPTRLYWNTEGDTAHLEREVRVTLPAGEWVKVEQVITPAMYGTATEAYLSIGFTVDGMAEGDADALLYVDDVSMTDGADALAAWLAAQETSPVSTYVGGLLYSGGTINGSTISGTAGSAVYTVDGTQYTAMRVAADYTCADDDPQKVQYDGNTWTVTGRGVLLYHSTGEELVVPTLEDAATYKASNYIIGDKLDDYWSLTDGTLRYSVLVKNVNKDKAENLKLTYRAYMTVSINGVEHTVYGNTVSGVTVEMLYDAAVAQGNTIGWFTEQ